MRTRTASILLGVSAAIYAITRGIAYLPSNRPDKLPGALDVLTEATGLTFWAVLWLAAALAALAGVALRRPFLTLGVAAMAAAWSLAYLIWWARSLLMAEPSREWLNAGSYAFPAVLVVIAVLLLARLRYYERQV